MTTDAPAITQRQREALDALCEPGTFVSGRRMGYGSDKFWIGDEGLPDIKRLNRHTALALMKKRLIAAQQSPERAADPLRLDFPRYRITELGRRVIGRQP